MEDYRFDYLGAIHGMEIPTVFAKPGVNDPLTSLVQAARFDRSEACALILGSKANVQ